MKFKDFFSILYKVVDKKYEEQFGFQIKETSFTKVANYLHAPKDASSLAITRISFGLAMLFDIPDERGGALLNKRWGDSKICHFPLFSFIQAVPLPYMALVYTALWIGALGIMLGYKYRIAAPVFTICYWYLFLIEKSYWNNHSYLFGLVSFLLTFTKADCYWSIDAAMEPKKFSATVPYWNYFILKFQFFILYFMAGVKKGTVEWLTGYSVPNLSAHWVFAPFTLFLTVEQTDYIIVHWFIFLFDLTVVFWMMWPRTRHIAMVFCALFHLMNSRLFSIGMFPWVCLATMPLFYPFDWPKLVVNYVKLRFLIVKDKINKMIYKTISINESKTLEKASNKDIDDTFFREDDATNEESQIKATLIVNTNSETCVSKELKKSKSEQIDSIKERNKEIPPNKYLPPQEASSKKGNEMYNHEDVEPSKKITAALIITYVTIQCFIPFSHFITKGYNNWTDGLYGYSWDMMVHTWDVQSVIVKVVDNEENNYFYIDPNLFSPNQRWFKHGDMVHQYVKCLNEQLLNESEEPRKRHEMLSKNISIFIDVWCSMNGRFVQRMFDPHVDLLNVFWSTFQRIPFLMPLLDEGSKWRPILRKIKSEVHSWNQYSDVIFFADFPGYALEKYIPIDLNNVTLKILEGEIAIEPEPTNLHNNQSFQLNTGHSVNLDSGMFYRIMNIGIKPAFYMFTFYNNTEAYLGKNDIVKPKPKLPVITELVNRFASMLIFAEMLFSGIYQSAFRLVISDIFSLDSLNFVLNVITSVSVCIYIMLNV